MIRPLILTCRIDDHEKNSLSELNINTGCCIYDNIYIMRVGIRFPDASKRHLLYNFKCTGPSCLELDGSAAVGIAP